MSTKSEQNYPVAVVGMHGRFPDAIDVKEFWTNLCEGNNTIKLVPDERWDWKEIFGSSDDESEKTAINCAAFMPMVDRFDHRFFGILPREAEAMDPQQRLFMQTAYAALEDAGYAANSLAGSNTGVFVGIGNADYPGMMRREGAAFDIYRATGLALTSIANRVSFSLDIHGPSESIDTACSGSLVAIHRAIQSMQYGECDRAIVGGVNLLIGPDLFIAFDKAGMLSKTARCRTFDKDANGYVRGEGVAALVLCPLEEAQANGDYIYAVIKGSAENHGGRAHSFTAPNATAQAEVVKTAWKRAGRNYHQACLIETHGTGTPLGDPIEINGLKKVSENFKKSQPEINPIANTIALGALKSHVGHLEATAGVAGVIKAILAMKYRTIPRNLNYQTLNPHISLDQTPYYIPSSNITLDHQYLLTSGVSSFGFGGVNAHIVLESYENSLSDISDQEVNQGEINYLIKLSAKDENGLNNRIQQMIEFLELSCNDSKILLSFESLMNMMLDALDVDHSALTISASTLLIDLALSPHDWNKALHKLSDQLGREVDFKEIVDCITLGDVVDVVRKESLRQRGLNWSDKPAINARVATPEIEIQSVSIGHIAVTLLEGRENFKHRLACVVKSKIELLKLLRTCQEKQNQSNNQILKHIIKFDDPVIEKPEKILQQADIEELTNWARWWVGTKNAELSWSMLYPTQSRPSKTPLPAYPFQLDKIWYKRGALALKKEKDHERTINNNSKNLAPRENNQLKNYSEDMLVAWRECQNYSQRSIPSSVLSIAYLLDYARYKSSNKIVKLSEVIVGTPFNINEDELVFSDVTNEQGQFFQCLSSADKQRVLIQGKRLIGNRTSGSTVTFAQSSEQLRISGDEYEQELDSLKLLIGPISQWVDKCESSENSLNLTLKLDSWKEKRGTFWVPLVLCILSGIAYLSIKKDKTFKLIWTVQSIVMSIKAGQSVRNLQIVLDPKDNTCSILMLDEEKSVVLTMQNITLRDSSVVQILKKQNFSFRSDNKQVGVV